jgi:hypothetical protein
MRRGEIYREAAFADIAVEGARSYATGGGDQAGVRDDHRNSCLDFGFV